ANAGQAHYVADFVGIGADRSRPLGHDDARPFGGGAHAALVVNVAIDEAGRGVAAATFNELFRLAQRIGRGNGGDQVAHDADIAGDDFGREDVDHLYVPDDEIKGAIPTSCGYRVES